MEGKTDIAKGRLEEAAGALADNDKLRHKGKTDQSIGRVKNAIAHVTEKVKTKLNK